MLYYIFWPFAWIAKIFLKSRNVENASVSGAKIVVSNHMRYRDPFLIGFFMPFGTVIHWFAAEELFSPATFFKSYYKHLGKTTWIAALLIPFVVRFSSTIPVDRSNNGSKVNRLAIKKAVSLLKEGRSIGIFGEGGIGKKGNVHPIFVSLAKKTGAAILPAKIDRKTVVFGEAISVNGDSRDSEVVAREIMEKIYSL